MGLNWAVRDGTRMGVICINYSVWVLPVPRMCGIGQPSSMASFHNLLSDMAAMATATATITGVRF
ncbi:MAG TPA: hypothetical protein VEP90_23045, partial [Methylomirabilota bacterium]|nr:hypothetical protein [Methylomirabilota bacterium]